jgi:hypothetical protein
MSLNEKLAEVCGMEWKQVYWCVSGVPKYLHHNAIDCVRDGMDLWNPAEGIEPNLNQLRECYLALSEDEKDDCIRIAENTCKGSLFDDQEGYAQAILKAKGVEV